MNFSLDERTVPVFNLNRHNHSVRMRQDVMEGAVIKMGKKCTTIVVLCLLGKKTGRRERDEEQKLSHTQTDGHHSDPTLKLSVE